jgi:hypothetical protein
VTAEELPIRVTLLDTLDELALQVPPTTPITEVKRTALRRSRIKRPLTDYVVKYKGAELYEGNRTLADAGVVPDGALIVLLRRRFPVK